MSAFDELVRRNREYADAGGVGDLMPAPRTGVMVVTCMDPRVEPAAFLGVGEGDAMVIRNSGGRMNDSTIADIAMVDAIRAAMGGATGRPLEIAVVHHTKCGSAMLANEDFRRGFSAQTGISEGELTAAAVADPYATVRADVERLKSSPLATDRIVVSGHVLDLETGLVETVVGAASPGTGQ
jgi:carbonic anhydrase